MPTLHVFFINTLLNLETVHLLKPSSTVRYDLPHIVSWLLKETTTSRSGYSMMTERVAVVSLTATTQISHHGICVLARTHCGCYKTSTTRNFRSWLFYISTTRCGFFLLNERFPRLSLTYI